MIYIFLSIIILEIGLLIYLRFKNLSPEIQKEVLRKIEPINSEVKKWQSPQEQEEEYHKKLLEDIINQ